VRTKGKEFRFYIVVLTVWSRGVRLREHIQLARQDSVAELSLHFKVYSGM